MKVHIRRLPHGVDLPLPSQASEGSAGLDLRAAIQTPQCLEPGERALLPTGLVLEIPSGWEGQVRPRSGLALRHGLTLPNSPGTIDSDYRGEVGVILLNNGQEEVTIEPGQRIAQLVVTRVEAVCWVEVEELSSTSRGSGGFGSTGE